MSKNKETIKTRNDNGKEPPYSEAIVFQEEKKRVVVYLNDKVAITFTVLLRKFDKRVPKEHILHRYDYAFNDEDGSIVTVIYYYTFESPVYGIKQILGDRDFCELEEFLGKNLISWLSVDPNYRAPSEEETGWELNIPGRLRYMFNRKPFNDITVIPDFTVSDDSCELEGIYLSYERFDLGYVSSDALICFYSLIFGYDNYSNRTMMLNEMTAEILADERICNMQLPWNKGVTVV